MVKRVLEVCTNQTGEHHEADPGALTPESPDGTPVAAGVGRVARRPVGLFAFTVTGEPVVMDGVVRCFRRAWFVES